MPHNWKGKNYLSGIFQLLFLNPDGPWVTEMMKSKIVDKGDHCNSHFHVSPPPGI